MIAASDKEKVEQWALGYTGIESMPLEMYDELGTESRAALATLKDRERRVLWALLSNCLSEEKLEIKALAESAGVSPPTINRLRHHEGFAKALATMVMNKLCGHADKIIDHLYRQSESGRTMATRLILELIRLYSPVSRVMSMQVNVDAKDMRGKSAAEVRQEVVQEWKEAGWSKEEFEAIWSSEE